VTDNKPLARAAPGRLQGRKQPTNGESYRIVGPDNKPLMTRDNKPVDGGGYPNKNLAVMRAGEINDYYANLPSDE
jgi:hypothetical protein